MTDSLETKLNELAIYLVDKAKAPGTDIQDSVNIFKELRQYHALLTKDDPKGDKDTGRRPTMKTFRENIALVSNRGGDEDDTA